MNNNIILINQNDEAIGETSVLDAHLGEAKLHRAYTAVLKNNKGEILLTRRSLKKPLWPTYWDGSFSSHPRIGETLENSCMRRAKEELGIKTSAYKDLLSYSYHVRWNALFSEWEINHILTAEYNGTIKPDSDEVSEYRWMSWEEAVKFSLDSKNLIAPWWEMAVKNSKLLIK